MSTPDTVLSIINSYLERHQHSQAPIAQLLGYIERQAMEKVSEPEFEDLKKAPLKLVTSHIEELESRGLVRTVRRDNVITSVISLSFFANQIKRAYLKNDEKPELPFPTEDSMGISVPPEDIVSVDIKKDFMVWMNYSEDAVKFLRVGFPDGITSLLVTSDLFKSALLRSSVQKIRKYLQDPKNLSFTRQRLIPVLKSRELAVKEMLQTITTSADGAASTVSEPTDFTFHLWTQLSTNIIKEYGPKADKLAEEHGYCQASYLIGYYNVFYRGRLQRRKDEDQALQFLMQMMRKPPFSYTISQILDFSDEKGVVLTRKIDRNKISNFVQEKLKPAQGKDIGEFLRIKTEKEEYYLLYQNVGHVVAELLLRSQKDMREFYQQSWTIALKQDIQFTTMMDDNEFRAHIEARLKARFPLLHGLLVYQIIYFASRIDGIGEIPRKMLADLINVEAQRLKTLDAIFRVNRQKLYDDARMLLPAWMVIPGLSNVIRFVRQMFLGKDMANKQFITAFNHEEQSPVNEVKKKAQENPAQKPSGGQVNPQGNQASQAASTKQQAAQFRAAAAELEHEFLPPGTPIQASLDSLASRWNTLLDPTAKKNLGEDVNSLVRDYLRKARITVRSKVPSPEDIKAHAVKIWETDSLLQIRSRKDLLRYIELYIIYLLENLT